MKITLVGPVYPYRGGIAHYTTSLSQELMVAGHQVQTISFKRQYPRWLYPGKSDRDPSLVHNQVPAEYILDAISPWTWFQAMHQILTFHPDLVVIMWWTTFWAPAFFLLSARLNKAGVNCVFCIHNVIPHENRGPDRWAARLVLSKAKGFITLSPRESERLRGLIPSAKIFLSRLPIPKILSPSVDREMARRALGIPMDQPVLFFFGIVRPYKGLSVLLDALGILRKEDFYPRLIIAGEFWENVQDYQNKINELSLINQVILENRYVPEEEVNCLFSAADAFVAPYTSGTQSAAIKTAMSYGLPVLASNQISGDLPVDSYPVSIHYAGSAEDLARSIRLFFEQNRLGIRAEKKGNDWLKVVDLLQTIAKEFAQEPVMKYPFQEK